ncbi:MAG TPA: hypothetical protein VFB80_17460, partial [Pirellulaceae bacterium]|nr:hypothetical protein [Pirellulaceae bacterium]
MFARPHPFRRYWLLFTVLFGCGLLAVASIGNSQDPQRGADPQRSPPAEAQRGADQPPAQSDRDKRLNAIEQTLQSLLKEVQALQKPDSDSGPPQTPAPSSTTSTGGGRRGQAPPPKLAL